MYQKHKSIFLVLSFFSFGCLGYAEIKVEATFEPATITLSNASVYKIVVHGSQQGPVGSVPHIEGLNFASPPRTLRSASFINGVPSIRFELSFTVTPAKTGTFTVPAWTFEVEKKSYQVPQTVLKVLPPHQEDKIRQAQKQQQQQDLKQVAFLEFICPRPFIFLGETVPAKVSLYLWDRLPVTRIEQIPAKTGFGFSMTDLGQPTEQRNVRKFNKSYTVYSWDFGLTGALIGKQKISFDSMIRVRVKNNRNSPFSNPFFSDPFFGFGREEGLKVSSESTDLEVRPIPLENRPSNFLGAIGDLSISSAIDNNRVSVGDPVRYTFLISGLGNFGAMPSPKLLLGDKFKVGPPAFSFEGNENTKQQGTQTFEFIVTPLEAGLIEIPPVSFTYFNPEQEKYYALNTNAHSLRVDPGEKWTVPESNGYLSTPEPLMKSSQDLFQTDSEPGKWIDSLSTPIPYKSNIFWIIQFIFFALFISALLTRLKKGNPRREAQRQKERLLEGKARDALKHKDPSGLYQALRRRIRLRVGIACNQSNASALSSTEIITLLHKKGYKKELIDEVVELLKICDESEYAGTTNGSSNIESTFQRTLIILKRLK
tara:strand:+ start:2820 stop:4610 length:1791 start_codon:yes stop_codon:yes gene_type:complete